MEEDFSVTHLSLGKEVALAASYVQGNAKLWLVHISEVGYQPANIRKFMELLATAVGSGNTDEWSGILSLSIK